MNFEQIINSKNEIFTNPAWSYFYQTWKEFYKEFWQNLVYNMVTKYDYVEEDDKKFFVFSILKPRHWYSIKITILQWDEEDEKQIINYLTESYKNLLESWKPFSKEE
jgi:hypothetical protein